MFYKLIVTCEHGGNQIPAEFQACFLGNQSILATHRGLDIGALSAFEEMKKIADFSLYSETSRLLIELNRSLHHKNLFSEFTKNLSEQEKERIIAQYYLPYRNAVEDKIRSFASKNHTVIHISVHSFTPELNGEIRNTDIGLLFDSRRKTERGFCEKWKTNFSSISKDLRVRYNYPYLGKADGFTTYLRKQFKEADYLGIELEINQRYFLEQRGKTIRFNLLKSLQTSL